MSLDSIPTVSPANVPSVTRAQMREVDRLMIEEYGVQLLQMMEKPASSSRSSRRATSNR